MKHYVGERTSEGCTVEVLDKNSPGGGYPLEPRFDLRNHSPDGFSWGYAGSGPAQLSLALLEDGNREVRKRIDRERLGRSSPEGATIKLADLIHNTLSIVKYDKGFARAYLKEKELLLEVLKHGNGDLWQRAFATLQEAQQELIQRKLSGGECGTASRGDIEKKVPL